MYWFPHTDSIRKYLNYCVRCIYYLRKVCLDQILINFYYAIVQSKLQYGIICWGGATANKVVPILKLQKRIIRILCKKHRLHASFDLFKKLSILPVKHLYCYKVLKLFFIRSGYLNSRSSNTYSLRVNSQNFVVVPGFRTCAYENFYLVASCRLFNSLPDSVRNIRLHKVFLKTIKIWLLNKNYDEVEDIFTTVT